MINTICLIWVGMQFNAPIWYFCLLGFALFIQILSYGIKMFNKGKASANK